MFVEEVIINGAPPYDARRPATWLPRCSRCGRWIKPPGGAAFGNGKTWCEPCAVLIDLERGGGAAASTSAAAITALEDAHERS